VGRAGVTDGSFIYLVAAVVWQAEPLKPQPEGAALQRIECFARQCVARSNCLVLDTLVNMTGLPACMLNCVSRMQPDQR
jgi:hypothetical protein